MRVLIVEDERKIADSIKKGLEQERYAVDVAYSGIDGFDLASTEDYDLIILDLMLPGMDGLQICKQLRTEGKHTPILMLTAKSQTTDKITGLDCGADDYLTKPFDFEELLSRLRALSRRPKTITSSILTVANLELDTQVFQATRNGKAIALSNTEFALLEYLLRNAGHPLSKDKIIAHVWNYDADILPNTVEAFIGSLRRKIDRPFPNQQPLIETVRGFGYRIRK